MWENQQEFQVKFRVVHDEKRDKNGYQTTLSNGLALPKTQMELDKCLHLDFYFPACKMKAIN